MPAISVIVPTYNAGTYIESCINSILAQDFRDFEIIIVDDASTDGTWEQCQRVFSDHPMVKLHRHKDNKGVSIARNTGLELAAGKYVAFVDSDDLILWNALSSLYETAEQWGADVVSADGYLRAEALNCQLLDEGAETASFEKRAGSHCVTETMSLPEDLRERLRMMARHEMLVFAWNRLYSRGFLESNRIRFPDCNLAGEDLLFHFVCMFRAKTYVRIPHFFYIYCQTPDSIIHSRKSTDWVGYLARSMALGVRYLRQNLGSLSFFRENPAVFDSVTRLLLENYKYEHIAKGKFYADYTIAPDVDRAVGEAFAPIFGEDTDFVKYLFHVMNVHFAEACHLMDENSALKEELGRLKKQA